MEKPIHYIDVALRIQYRPSMEKKILAAARKLARQKIGVPSDDPKDSSCRPMTAQETAEEIADVQDSLFEIMDANPLLAELKLELIASSTGPDAVAERFEDLPELRLIERG